MGGEGRLDANAMARVIRIQIGGIEACYNRALRTSPALAGRVTVRFTIGTSGRITSASANGMDPAPDVGTCMAGVVRGMVFQAPEGGSADFSFPFNLAVSP